MAFEFKVTAKFVFWAPAGAVAKTAAGKPPTLTLQDLAQLNGGSSLTPDVILSNLSLLFRDIEARLVRFGAPAGVRDSGIEAVGEEPCRQH